MPADDRGSLEWSHALKGAGDSQPLALSTLVSVVMLRLTFHLLQHLVKRLVFRQGIPELLNASCAQSLTGVAHDAAERGNDVLSDKPAVMVERALVSWRR